MNAAVIEKWNHSLEEVSQEITITDEDGVDSLFTQYYCIEEEHPDGEDTPYSLFLIYREGIEDGPHGEVVTPVSHLGDNEITLPEGLYGDNEGNTLLEPGTYLLPQLMSELNRLGHS
jgi:uncharacterized protein YrzB (UPF0473 family)